MHKAVKNTLSGRRCCAYELGKHVLERLEETDRAGMNEWRYDRRRFGAMLAVAETEVMRGAAGATERMAELLQKPGYRSDAWRWLVIYHARRGDMGEARRCERRAELAMLQDGTRQFGSPKTLMAQAIAGWLSDDLEGLKQLLDRFERMAQRYPGWRLAHYLVEAHYLRLKGELPTDLERVEAALPLAVPGSHVLCAWVAAAHVWLLTGNGRAEQAADRGRDYTCAFSEREFDPGDYRNLTLATAEALARCGRFEQACELLDAAVADLERVAARGVLMGLCCGDARTGRARDGTERPSRTGRSAVARRLRQAVDSPALSAKFGRLLQEAQREAPREAPHSCEGAAAAETGDSKPEVSHVTEMSRMQECVTSRERAYCALRRMLEQSMASEGHLYGLIKGKLTHLASVRDASTGDELLATRNGPNASLPAMQHDRYTHHRSPAGSSRRREHTAPTSPSRPAAP